VGQAHIKIDFIPLKKQNLQKIFGLNPVGIKTGLTLSARKARGVAKKQWALVTDARQKVGKIKDCLIVECLYDSARTYFEHQSRSD
jgi:hypothetical protein